AGAALVRDPRVHTIAFTGSSAVGLEIIEAAAETREEQNHVKRVVAEMGGKNCVIVDSDADLDEVVPGVVRSAFVYAGQKCSAAPTAAARRRSSTSSAARRSATSTSTATSPARWWAASRSAETAAAASARRPAAPTTSCSSSSHTSCPRTRCGTGSRWSDQND